MKKENHPEIRKAIRRIISEYNRYLIEGIDINLKTKVVSFNPSHENNVDTSILLNPTYDEINGVETDREYSFKSN